ncbi:MAG: acyl-CoA/acyl-ACP dehydrogenase [Pseudomonadota bacterium]|nr:acyl-CoA/acyl-ACP dehydrogenase [Pseudomonadota bacterium]
MAVLSEDQQLVRDSARDWAAERAPVAALRRLRDGGSDQGFDPALWREMGELGWPGVAVSEAHGGSGLGWAALGLILAETGRHLTASPLLAHTLATAALELGGSEAMKAEWLPRLALGELTAALAVDEGPHHAPDRLSTRFEAGRLDGTKRFVPDGMAADILVVAALADGGPALAFATTDAPGLQGAPRRLADSRGWADISLAGVPAEPLGGREVLETVLDRAYALLAAEMLGAATAAFEMTLAYLKTRTQFGQLIGGFQALQHRAAQMFTELQLAQSCVEAALLAVDADGPDLPALASLAKARANDVLHRVSNETVQMHGGIGMTDEHDAGLYLKRARTAEALYGGSAFHRDRYARLNGF